MDPVSRSRVTERKQQERLVERAMSLDPGRDLPRAPKPAYRLRGHGDVRGAGRPTLEGMEAMDVDDPEVGARGGEVGACGEIPREVNATQGA